MTTINATILSATLEGTATLTGAATVLAAIQDANDASYVEVGGTGPAFSMVIEVPTQYINRVRSITYTVRSAFMTSNAGNQLRIITDDNVTIYAKEGAGTSINTVVLPPYLFTAAPAQNTQPNLYTQFRTLGNTGNTRIYEVSAVLDVVAPQVFTVLHPLGTVYDPEPALATQLVTDGPEPPSLLQAMVSRSVDSAGLWNIDDESQLKVYAQRGIMVTPPNVTLFTETNFPAAPAQTGGVMLWGWAPRGNDRLSNGNYGTGPLLPESYAVAVDVKYDRVNDKANITNAFVVKEYELPSADGRLGDGTYTARIRSLANGTLLLVDEYLQGNWSRTSDTPSTAMIRMPKTFARRYKEVLSTLQPWDAVLEWWRDDVREWSGPITNMSEDWASVTLAARDWSCWFDRADCRWSGLIGPTTGASLAMLVAGGALALADSPPLVPVSYGGGSLVTRELRTDQTVGSILGGLTTAAIDTTVRDLAWFVGGEAGFLGELPPIYEATGGSADQLSLDVLEVATRVRITSSAGGDLPPIVAEASRDSDGPRVTRLINDSSVLTQATANELAVRELAQRQAPPLKLTPTLTSDYPLSASRLIPCTTVDVKVNGILRTGVVRCKVVTVTCEVSDGSGRFTVEARPLEVLS